KLNEYVRRYFPHEIKEFASYISDSEVRHMISEFYGKVKGFQYDGVIQKEELEVIRAWHSSIKPFAEKKGLGRTIEILESILKDGVVTLDEAKELEDEVARHLNNIPSSQITVSTQILEGILKGIKTDRVIKEEECRGLREWLVSHDYLRGHYPFDRVMAMVDEILEDGIVTETESERIISCISSILDPVKTSSQNNEDKTDDLCGKIICLSGNFAYGTKSDVEEYLKAKGAVIESSVKKTTNILLVGSLECTQWSNGNYGTKVVKAMDYNERYGKSGVSIKIMKENELIKVECSKKPKDEPNVLCLF
ncbi:MAG: hypothetical protein ACI4SL_05555, partial [Candidatus Ornithospirochaeta sp.]